MRQVKLGDVVKHPPTPSEVVEVALFFVGSAVMTVGFFMLISSWEDNMEVQVMTEVRQVSVEHVIESLQTRQDSLEWAVVALMGEQTDSEVMAGITAFQNGVGYNAADAGKMTYYAKYMTGLEFPKLGDPIQRHLSGKFLTDARERIVKYAKQITKLINAEFERKAQERLTQVTGGNSH